MVTQLVAMSVFSRFAAFTRRHPIVRGMISYSIIWPTSSIIQQTVAGKRWDNYDWKQAMRYSLYGSMFTAPTLYAWVRISTLIWPTITLRTAITKVSIVYCINKKTDIDYYYYTKAEVQK